MKRIYTILLIASTLFFFACQQEEKLGEATTGYLRLSINEDISTNSRAEVPADYDPEKIGVQILNAQGGVQETLEPWEIGTKKSIELPVGTYTIKASSAGWDGKAAGLDCPYYTGSKQVTITANAELNETITCTLANVKVTAMVYPELAEKVNSVKIKVYSESSPVYSQNLTGESGIAAYFPVVDALYADITIVNKANETNTLEKQQLGDREGKVNARDHYILNIKPQDSGSSQISVTVDPTTHEYSYIFGMSTKPTESATLTAGAWDRLAYLQATDIVAGTGVSMEGIKFQYREKAEETDQTDEETAQTDEEDEASWTDVATTQEEDKYTAMLTGLKASTEYEYRLVNGEKVAIGKVQSFTTEAADAQTPLQNGGFEDWSTIKTKPISFLPEQDSAYPNASSSISFWDTSNAGANVMGVINPTQGVSSPVYTQGGTAAQLKSQEVSGLAFAAASLYTGSFGSANIKGEAIINFGQPFVSRPIALHGYYQYSPVNVGDVSGLPEDATISSGSPDQCAIYIALAKKTYSVNNKQENTFIDFEGDDNIIAYGTIEGDYVKENSASNGYTEFTIPLQYKESQFGETPTHIIIVCSASKYGDYMVGGNGSTMYLDDFSLDYEGTPAIWKNK